MSKGQAAPILLVALGGNALIKKGQEGTIAQQFANLQEPIAQIARLSRDHRVIITHGNGPQVGNLLLQQECCQDVPRLPLEILVAQTQGQIGYMIESSLDNQFMALGLEVFKPLVSLISYVVVDGHDPAFANPDKPIGPVLSGEQAAGAAYPVMHTAKGWRRAVASPQPISIVEKREIKRLIGMDFIVICCGGGGIPVVRQGRHFAGVDAVIDKDLASARLGLEVGVEVFCMATDVPGAALDYGQPGERFLDSLSLDETRRYLEQGQFHPGSMGPKVRAALMFLEGGGQRALICSTQEIEAALAGKAGTHFHL
ncbi:MAG: carbamate kinase [Desulfarculus sp.]|nr:carbamate kinase [Desulfarculus sp.]